MICGGPPCQDGSSPRVRGTRRKVFLPLLRWRFIPACAGNTARGCRKARKPPVHPRVCGEHAGQRRPVLQAQRFIPACAGNTTGPTPPASIPPVHPRVCGEHGFQPVRDSLVCGSSPRVRGTPEADDLQAPHRRFIPACAGNTATLARRWCWWPVHPRVCGEHGDRLVARQPRGGSSPRVRGTRGRPLVSLRESRFIPACAGNTRPGRRRPARAPVHPRVCAEHLYIARMNALDTGSSPRVRGTRHFGE